MNIYKYECKKCKAFLFDIKTIEGKINNHIFVAKSAKTISYINNWARCTFCSGIIGELVIGNVYKIAKKLIIERKQQVYEFM